MQNNEKQRFAGLLRSAVEKPGTLSTAYRQFHNYSLGNQLLAMCQCHQRGIALGPMTTFSKWKALGRRGRVHLDRWQRHGLRPGPGTFASGFREPSSGSGRNHRSRVCCPHQQVASYWSIIEAWGVPLPAKDTVPTSLLQRFSLWGLCLLVASACAEPSVTVQYRIVDGHRFSWSEKRTIQAVGNTAVVELQALLHALPEDLVLDVRPGDDVIDELGAGGGVAGQTYYWIVDPHRVEGVSAIAEAHLRPFLFHESHHLVRHNEVGVPRSVMDWVISEGLASAFERDFAGATYPWTTYPEEVPAWVAELAVLPDEVVTDPEERDQWMHAHPDGRQWIGYRAGIYLVDRATRASGMSSATLVSTPTTEILRLASTR